MTRLLFVALALAGCADPKGQAAADPAFGSAPAPAAPTPAPYAPSSAVAVDAGGPTLLPDDEPAGAPFASAMAAALAEVTQGGAAPTIRVYRAAYEQARREINSDNAYDRLQELEDQIDLERHATP